MRHLFLCLLNIVLAASCCCGNPLKEENNKKKLQIYMNADSVLQPSGKHYVTDDGQFVTSMTMGEIDRPNSDLEELALRQSFNAMRKLSPIIHKLPENHETAEPSNGENIDVGEDSDKENSDEPTVMLSDDSKDDSKDTETDEIERVPNKNKEVEAYIKDSAIKAHNKLRAKHHVPPLEWSDVLAKEAQRRADYYAENPSMISDPPGQNVAQIWHDFTIAGQKASLLWYDESRFYSFSSPRLSPKTKHFTQMIWKNTKYMGIGGSPSLDGKYLLVVALYSPKGNEKNTLRDNLLPANSQGKDVYATIN